MFRNGDGETVIGDFDTGAAYDFLDLIDDHVNGVDGEVAVNAGKGDRIVLDGIDLANLRAELFFL